MTEIDLKEFFFFLSGLEQKIFETQRELQLVLDRLKVYAKDDDVPF